MRILGLLTLIYLYKKAIKRDHITPFFVACTLPFAMIIYDYNIGGKYLQEITLIHTIYLSMGIIPFIAGLNFATKFKLERPKNYKRLPWFLLLFIGILPHILGLLTTGAPILANDVEEARSTYKLPVINFFHIGLILATLAAYKNNNGWQKLVSVACLFFFSIIMLSKFDIVLALITVIIGKERYDRPIKLNWKTAFVGVLLILLTFNIIGSLRHGSDIYKYAYVQRSDEIGLINNKSYLWLPLYFYTTAPLSNMVYIYDIDNLKLNYGRSTLNPIYTLLQIDDIFPVREKPVRMEPFNTHTFLADFYIDFGLTGQFILSGLLGFLIMRIYLKSFTSQDIYDVALWVVFLFASMMIFFSNHFTSVGYPLLYGIVIFILKRLSVIFIRYE